MLPPPQNASCLLKAQKPKLNLKREYKVNVSISSVEFDFVKAMGTISTDFNNTSRGK